MVLDDLAEYQAVFARDGLPAVQALFAAGRHESDQAVRIVDATGRVVLEGHPLGHPDWTWDAPGAAAKTAPDGTDWMRRRLADGTTLTLGRRGLPGGGEIWFGRTDAADRRAIASIRRMIGAVLVIVLLLAVGPVIWFSGRVLRPLQRLMRDAGRLAGSQSTLQRLDAAGAIPEVRALAAAFNDTFSRLHAATEELESANDQLAHELRTPLTRIRTMLEAAITQHPGVDPAREYEARALAEVDRATRLIQWILTIRSGESRSLRLRLASVRLAAVAASTCDLYAAAAEEKGLRLLTPDPSDPLEVQADTDRVQQALCGLLDNALAYTPRGGQVRVEVRREPGEALIAVADTGPGLTTSDLTRIWQRFTRGSAASAEVAGLGLGLSVVRAILRAHGGDATAHARPDGGAEFALRFPVPGETRIEPPHAASPGVPRDSRA